MCVCARGGDGEEGRYPRRRFSRPLPLTHSLSLSLLLFLSLTLFLKLPPPCRLPTCPSYVRIYGHARDLCKSLSPQTVPDDDDDAPGNVCFPDQIIRATERYVLTSNHKVSRVHGSSGRRFPGQFKCKRYAAPRCTFSSHCVPNHEPLCVSDSLNYYITSSGGGRFS